MKKALVIFVVAHLGGLAAFAKTWNSLTASKKRFVIHMAKQVPWMPFRYFA